MEPLAQYGGNSLRVDVIFCNQHIPMVSGMTQLVACRTIDMHGDNVTALYRHSYLACMATHAPGNKVGTKITIILIKELG